MRRKKSFTLIELLVVLAILGFFVAMMTKVFTSGDDQRRFDETRIRMEEIKKAILGNKGAYANGQRQFAGYAADMGSSASLVDGTDLQGYKCIKAHRADNNNRPITGGNWANFWVLDNPTPPGVTWNANTIYVSQIAMLSLDFSVTGTDGNNYRCLTLHIAENANRPITGANWADYWIEDSSMLAGTWHTNTVYAASFEMLWLALPTSVDGHGVPPGQRYRCIKTHLKNANNRPESGANWANFWERDDTMHGGDWNNNDIYGPPWVYQGNDSRIWCGWRGPYVEAPPHNILKDGWGNPFHITISTGDITIESWGADNADDVGGEIGYDIDIEMTVRLTEYEAPVAGRVKGFNDALEVKIALYSPVNGNGTDEPFIMTVGVPIIDGYFRFEPRDSAVEPLPEAPNSGRKYTTVGVGTRSCWAWEDDNGNGQWDVGELQKKLIFTIEPTGNWLGDIEIQ